MMPIIGVTPLWDVERESVWMIPESEAIMAVIAVGYRADEPSRPARRDLDEIVKFF